MDKYHIISSVQFEGNTLILEIDSKVHKFNLRECSVALFKASKSQRDNYEISPSGYGINWPMIDEDISIDGLLGINHSIPSEMIAS